MIYKEIKFTTGGIYKGYVNHDGQLEGVGINTYLSGKKEMGEYHLNKLNGYAKVEKPNNISYWGEFKENKKEGYGTYVSASGSIYTGQFINDKINGYGIKRWVDGNVYHGEFKDRKRDG